MDDPEEMALTLGVQVDDDTNLPQVFLGIPATTEEIEVGLVSVSMSPMEALRVAAFLIQIASTAAEFWVNLQDKTLEERAEIIAMESSFFNSLD